VTSPPQLSAALPGSLYFVADLHLPAGPSRRGEAFEALLSLLARPPQPAGLYILGDLFDLWSGKASIAHPAHQPVISALGRLAESGVEITVLRGNRDFLLDGDFASRSSSRVVDDGLTLRLGSRRAYLCHGDHLFQRDRAHQISRAVLRSALCRTLAAALPSRAVDAVAHWIRGRSESAGRRGRAGNGGSPERLGVIPARSAARIFRGGFDCLIAGHVHEERRRVLTLEGRTCEMWTLGAWEERGSVLEFSGETLKFYTWTIPEALKVGSRKSEVGSFGSEVGE
jgi:UDP-2,3-diacylglucosamine hydrolase